MCTVGPRKITNTWQFILVQKMLLVTFLFALFCVIQAQDEPWDLIGMGYDSVIIPLADGSSSEIFWLPLTDETTLSMAVSSSTSGWVAVGFTQGTYSMVGSDAVVGWVNDTTGVTTVQFYHLNGQTDVLVNVNNSVTLTNIQGQQINGTTTIMFTRKINDGANPIVDGAANMISSHGTNDILANHNNARATGLTFANFTTGETNTTEDSADFKKKAAHGAIEATAFAIIFPFSMMVARFGRSKGQLTPLAFHIHWSTQAFGTILVFAGVVIGYVVSGPFDELPHPWPYHAYLGTILFVLALVNVVLGIARPSVSESGSLSLARKIFNIVHPWIGRLMLLFGIPQIISGIFLLGYPWGLALWIPFAVLTFMIFCFLEWKYHLSRGSGGKYATHV